MIMRYYRNGGKYNYYVVVSNKDGEVELVHPLQLKKSDKVLFETINKDQWYDFAEYCTTKYNINVRNFNGTPSEIKALWEEFDNDNGSI